MVETQTKVVSFKEKIRHFVMHVIYDVHKGWWYLISRLFINAVILYVVFSFAISWYKFTYAPFEMEQFETFKELLFGFSLLFFLFRIVIPMGYEVSRDV